MGSVRPGATPPDVEGATNEDQAAFYDARYDRGYMGDFFEPYEACRLVTVQETLRRIDARPARILDYGCGQGRYLGVLAERFPQARLAGCDVSEVGLEQARASHPDAQLTPMADERVPLADGSFDLILSVEVLEHVADAGLATRELARLLAPGGHLVVTTPCANPGSFEWILNRLRGGLQATPDGYGRFATDEPGHLRRLTSRDLRVLLSRAGLTVQRVDFRAHLFSALMVRLPRRVSRLIGARMTIVLGLLDWRLFKRLPNAATMVVVARRP
jgi:SAM-dependent methyltransferase